MPRTMDHQSFGRRDCLLSKARSHDASLGAALFGVVDHSGEAGVRLEMKPTNC